MRITTCAYEKSAQCPSCNARVNESLAYLDTADACVVHSRHEIFSSRRKPTQRMTTEELAIQLRSLRLSLHGRSDHTKRQYTEATQRFADWMGEQGLADLFPERVTRHHVNAWLGSLSEAGLKGSTLRWYYRGLYGFYMFLAEDMPDAWPNPMLRVKCPKVDESPKDVVSTTQMDQVLRSLDAAKRYRDAAIVSLICDNGMREGELTHIKNTQVDWEQMCILLPDTKNGDVRFAPFTPATARRLDRWRAKRTDKSEWLFTGQRGRLTESGLLQLVKRIFKEHGMPNVGPHDLRHSFAVAFMARQDEGATWQDMKAIGGWKSDGMAQHYAKQGDKMRALKSFRRLNGMAG